MIATFLTEPTKGVNHPPTVHAVFQVGREGLKVKTHAYCSASGNAAEGTYQIPDWAFDRPTYQPIPQGTHSSNWIWQVCSQCSTALKHLREPPR